MLQRIPVFLTIAAAMLLAVACRPVTAPSAAAVPAANPLIGTSWILTELNGQPALSDTEVTLTFATDGSAFGTDGCNNYRTTVTVDGSNITFNPNAAATMMACPEPIMNQSTAYYAALTSAATFQVDAAALVLSDSAGTAVATFAAQSDDLSGTAWEATGYNNGKQAVVSVLTGTTLTAQFAADGTISGSGGCNNFGGTYATADNKIEISQLISTMMACMTPEGVMEQEAQYLAALQTAATYRVDGSKLELRTADGAMAATFQRSSAPAADASATEAAANAGDTSTSPVTTSELRQVTGTVTYLESGALPADAVVEISIRNAQLADAPPEKTLLAITKFPTNGQQIPLPYSIDYDAAQVQEGALYSISARITDAAGKLLFISTQVTPVITNGNPTENVEIIVQPASAN